MRTASDTNRRRRTELKNLLVPTVNLAALDASGSKVTTSLSSSEATFVSGVFADQSKATTTGAAAAASATAAVAAAVAFVLPGTKILIFPVGAIITGTWAVLGIATVMYGTIGRMNFRAQYRARSARADKGGQARI